MQVLSRRDVVIAAETGSGKTLAYVLPLLELLMRKSDAAVPESQDEISKAPQTDAPSVSPSAGLDVSAMKVSDLREALKARGLVVSGLKADLITRLTEAINTEAVAAATATGPQDDSDSSAASTKNEEKERQESFPQAVVLAPSRELVQQILAMAVPMTEVPSPFRMSRFLCHFIS